jgi:hypothetical protein
MTFKTTIRNFFDPRFSTEDVENSKLKCNLHFRTLDMYFDDKKKGFPTHIIGVVKTPAGALLKVSWNQHGECVSEGIRLHSFDLVRPTQKEIDAARPLMTSMVILFIASVVYAIF